MPRHEQISPEEDLASYYGTTPSSPAAKPPPVPAAAPGGPPPVPAGAVSATPLPPVDEPLPGASPGEPASEPKRVAPVQRPMPTFPPEAAPVPANAPNAVLAAVISAILPGAGQVYAGQTIKGVVILAVAFFTCMGGGLFNVFAAIDAFLIAQRRARGETVGDWQFF